MSTLKKLKIVGSISVYSTGNTWQTYKDIVHRIKNRIVDGDIKVNSVKYGNEFDEKYNQYTNIKNWGTNLDEYVIKINYKLKATISYYHISRYSSQFENRTFKFEISFDLPKDLLFLFKSEIEKEFYYKCVEIREKELEKIEEDRIKEIGRELLERGYDVEDYSSCFQSLPPELYNDWDDTEAKSILVERITERLRGMKNIKFNR